MFPAPVLQFFETYPLLQKKNSSVLLANALFPLLQVTCLFDPQNHNQHKQQKYFHTEICDALSQCAVSLQLVGAYCEALHQGILGAAKAAKPNNEHPRGEQLFLTFDVDIWKHDMPGIS